MSRPSTNIEAALSSAFPATTIDRGMIDEPSADWSVYDDRAELASFEGKTWREIPDEVLVRHSTLPIYAGDALFRATLPAYLAYLLRGPREVNDLPFQLAGQLTRKSAPEAQAKFDRRIAPLSEMQRLAVRDAIAQLATMSPMEETMSHALVTWTGHALERT